MVALGVKGPYRGGVARRVLLLITDLLIGGTPTVVRELAVRLTKASNAHVEAACLSGWGPVADQLTQQGIGVTALNAGSALDMRIIPRLVKLLRYHRIDMLFSFLVHANTVAALAKPLCPGLRLLASIQTTQPDPAWHWGVQSLVHRAAESIVVPSPSVGEVARLRSHVPGNKIIVIPNAIDPDAFPRSQVPHTQPTPYPIGFIGRLDPIKRIPDLVEAVAPLAGQVHLHLFGEGPERVAIERTIKRLNLGAAVTLHGGVQRPQDALQSIGLLVLPSAAEGFGLVLIEAMASGVPVVARNVPGVRDVVRDNENGLLAATDSIEDLTRSIERIIEDDTLRRRLINAGLVEVTARYSWSTVLPRYRALLGI